jgi:hypothetical protein
MGFSMQAATSMLSLGTLGFFYAFALFSWLSLAGPELNLALFLTSVVVLPLVCAVVQAYLLRPDLGRPWASVAESINTWTVVVGLASLTVIVVIKRVLAAGAAFWTKSANAVVLVTLTIHVMAIALLLCVQLANAGHRHEVRYATEFARLRTLEVYTLTAVIFITIVALFRIEPSTLWYTNRYPLLAGFGSAVALTGACALLIVAAALLQLEAAVEQRNRAALGGIRSIALFAAAVLTCVLYFDFSLYSDPLHYLTNIGPAVHLLHGGRLMVDTFSQYGPGPVVATMLGFEIGPMSFGMANLTVQLFNLTFYIVFLVCLYQMTSKKLAALLLGLFATGIMLAMWHWGETSINLLPSILGFRYLPPLLMVLGLSLLQPPNRWSFLTAFATFFASLWSLETLAGTLAIHLLFLLMITFRERSYSRLPFDALMLLPPAAAGILLMIAVTGIWEKSLPDYRVYLWFLTHYSMLSSYWAIAADGLFWGWVPILLAYFLVMGVAWLRIIGPTKQLFPLDDRQLFHRYVPMAGLLVVMITYYAGRAVDFTAAIALLPFCAIAIPAGLEMVSLYQPKRWASIIPVSIPILAALWSFTYSFHVLYGKESRYSFALQQCRDQDNCTPRRLLRAAKERLQEKWLDHPGADSKGIAKEAARIAERWAADREKLVMLLGPMESGGSLSEVALVQTGKWHLWPRSYTFSDDLNDVLREKILRAPVKLREGDVVIVRKDEESLGLLERGILQKVRLASNLCALPETSNAVAAYRVSLSGAC